MTHLKINFIRLGLIIEYLAKSLSQLRAKFDSWITLSKGEMHKLFRMSIYYFQLSSEKNKNKKLAYETRTLTLEPQGIRAIEISIFNMIRKRSYVKTTYYASKGGCHY